MNIKNKNYCLCCGKELIQKEKESNKDFKKRKYCNKSCKSKHWHSQNTFYKPLGIDYSKYTKLVCKNCGDEFLTYTRNATKKGRKYCSQKCAYAAITKHKIKEFNGKRYYLQKKGYYCSTDGHRLNRDVWEYYNGPIPKGYLIHHKDENKTNDDISNLELIEWGEHTIRHHKGKTRGGISYGYIKCKHCGKYKKRRMALIKIGQTKFCSQECCKEYRKIHGFKVVNY